MRIRSVPLIVAIFGAAALTATFVVRQLPREGDVSLLADVVATPPPAAPATPPVDPPASSADGAIEVRVTAGGEPQRDAAVRLYLEDDRGRWWRAGEERSDSAGVARAFARPGTHLVAVRARGFATARVEVIRAAGEEVTRLEVPLEPPAALAGHVTAKHGGALTRTRVRAIPIVSRWPGFGPPSAPPEETAAAEVDAAGRFRIEGLAPGWYAVAAEAPGFHPVLLPRVAIPGDLLAIALEPLGGVEGVVLHEDGRAAGGASIRASSADHGATTVAGSDGSFSLAIPAGGYRVHAALGDRAGAAPPLAIAAGATLRGVEIRLGAGAVLEGEVVHLTSGGGAAGAEVAIFPPHSQEIAARAVTDGAGRFRIAGLPPGAFDVRASAPGASPAVAAGVSLVAGRTFPLRLALAGTGAAEGVVADTAGRPLAGARVRVLQRGDGLAAPPLETHTDFEGRWRIEGLEVGRADLVARQDGVALGVARAIRVSEGRTSRADFFLPEAGFLSGRVHRDGKPPPAGTAVVAVSMKAGPGTLQVARATADATGNYSLALPAGEYRVHAAPAEAVRTDLRVSPGFARIEPRRTARLDLAAAQPAAEEGVVEILVLEPGGAPSAGAVVTLARPGDSTVALATSAGEDGRVALGRDMGLAGRPVVVRARNGGRTGTVAVDLPPAGTVPVTLAAGGAVHGVVRARGGAVSGFTVEVTSQPAAAGWRTLEVHRFAGDRFEIGDVPAEPLRLLVRTEDGRHGQADLRVAAGEVRDVEIALVR
jgi:hypothetical protein